MDDSQNWSLTATTDAQDDRTLREQVVLPRCRCRHVSFLWDRCPGSTDSPDAFLCRDCEADHRPGEPGSPFMLVPLADRER